MSRRELLCAVAGLALAAASAPALNAQRGFGEGFGHGEGFGGFHGQVVTGAPFSATRTITHTQTLTDGTVITHTETIKEARDSEGRLFSQTIPSTTNEGGPASRSFVHIFDPVSRTATTYNADSKQANVLHLPDPSQFHGPRGADNDEAGPRFNGRANMPAETSESLGSKTVNGLVADGTRTTRVIPAGAHGNDKPITVTHESWVSSDLKVEVMRVDTDPRMGTTTVQLTNISRDEPAASLFQAPAGYTVNERTVGAHNGRPVLQREQ